MAPHERLKAWQATHRLVLAWYRVTDGFPVREKYGLTAQIRRSAFSAGANIAEGAAKSSPRDFARFLDIALGSLGELEYAQRLAADLAYLVDENLKEIGELQASAGRLTRRLHQAIVARGKAVGAPNR
jgi:four helix bundle protein